MSFAPYATVAGFFKRTGWLTFPKPFAASEPPQQLSERDDQAQTASPNPQQLTNVGNATPHMSKVPVCWRLVEEYEERERNKEVAAQYSYSAPAPAISLRSFVKPAPAPAVRAPNQSCFSDPSLRKHVTTLNFSSAPVAPIALTDSNLIEDHVERRRFINEKLASILGPERMNFQLLPSGHSGIDPVIAQHNQNVATQDLFNKFHAHQAERRQIAERRQCQIEAEEAARLKTSILLDHYRAQYLEHVKALAAFGPMLTNAIGQLETAMGSQINYTDIPGLVSKIVSLIFVPVHAIIKEMNEKIPLEEQGSAKLQTTWPLENLEKLLRWIHQQQNLPEDFQNLGKAIEVICNYISKPTPFKNPLDPQPQQLPIFYQSWTGGSANGNFMSNLATSNAGAPQAPAAPTSDLDRNFGSFAELANAQTQASAAASGNPTIPAINITAPTPTVPSASFNTSELTHYMTIELLELEYNARDLVNNKGEISYDRRRDIIAVFKKTLELAKNSEGFFGPNEFDSFRAQIDRVINKIASLRKRNERKTVELNCLARDIKKFWQ